MQEDAKVYVKICKKCQKFSPMIRTLAEDLVPLTSPWPFAQWGMDIVGPLHKATGNRKFLLVATDYFTKWIEAEPLAKITEPMIERFVWKNIITRFGVPYSLITDNGSQFQKKFKAFCGQYGIRNYYSTPAYPQSNGQAEASNKTILDGIKKRLDKAKGKWPDELPLVLWASRTTPRRSTGETPYSLAYGTEAVIPLEVGLPTNRTALVESGGNDRALEIELDLAEEMRERALVHLASYQEQLMKSYNKNVHPREFGVGDLVLRKVLGNTKVANEGKLRANWEGPYRVTEIVGIGAYRLADLDGNPVPRPWNVHNLRRFFV
jgi:hypothetical protein